MTDQPEQRSTVVYKRRKLSYKRRGSTGSGWKKAAYRLREVERDLTAAQELVHLWNFI